MLAKFDKPPLCIGCSLETLGKGYAPADGPDAELLFVGESLGYQEAMLGRPFMGAAGGMFQRILDRSGIRRELVKVHNCVNCFPGDTVIQAPGLRKGIRRRYVGPITSVETWHGTLSGTPNHPVLTATGWKALGEVQQGDYLVRPCSSQRMLGGDPDVYNVPTSIAQTYKALADRGGCTRMAGTNVDFHGDGSETEIEVVSADGVLGSGKYSALLEHLLQNLLEPPDFKAGALTPAGQAFGAALLLRLTPRSPAHRRMGRCGDFSAVLADRTAEAEALGLCVRTLQEIEEREGLVDLPVSQMKAFLDRFRTLTSHVELSEVVRVTLSQFDGHVYNLETGTGKYTANGFVVHNCQPPGDWLDGAPWQFSALTHCRGYLQESLNNAALKCVVTLGAIPLKSVLDLWGAEGVRVQDFHGTVHRDPSDRFWVVPTYHSSYLQRGAVNLLDVVRFDLGVAQGLLREGGYRRRAVSLLLDIPVAHFRAWADAVLAAVRADPTSLYLAVDIETPDKEGGRDEGELTPDDRSTDIHRVNFSCNPDEGLTVPYEGPYIPIIEELLACGATLLMWFKQYDESRLRFRGHPFVDAAGSPIEILDLMWAAHHLESDWPLGLGFWAPFSSDYGAWKHLGKIKGKEAEYGAVDGLQTTRVGHDLIAKLVAAGLWEAFYRHTHLREQYVLRPAHEVGIPVDTERLDAFHERLQLVAAEKLGAINTCEVAGSLRPKVGYRDRPEGPPPKSILGSAQEKGDQAKHEYLVQGTVLVQKEVEVDIQVCLTCGKRSGVGPKHNCLRANRRKVSDGSGVPEGAGAGVSASPSEDTTLEPPRRPDLATERVRELRWFWKLPFNPDAPQQILAFIKDSGEAPGRAKKTKKDTTDKATMKRLARKTKDPLYTYILDYKAVKKVDSTYAIGFKNRIWSDGRLHPQVTFRPSMGRDSYVSPNPQNVIADKEGKNSLAAGFRHCIVAPPGHRIVEVDYSGIEGLNTGWLSGDPDYIRLAALGVHAYLTSYVLAEAGTIGAPADLNWSDADLAVFFKEIKGKFPFEYDKCKRVVHGNNYGLTPYGMYQTFPEMFPTLKVAEHVQDLYYALCPKLQGYHKRVRELAYTNGHLGGSYVDDYHLSSKLEHHHPYAYRHSFWGVQSFRPLSETDYRKLQWVAQKKMKLDRHPRVVIINSRPFERVMGEDSKRVIAFGPQSIAGGTLKEAELNLFHPDSPSYVGEINEGTTPLLAPIHDSLLMCVLDKYTDYLLSIAIDVMRRPIWQMPLPEAWGMGSHLRVNVAAKISPIGGSWEEVESVKIPDMLPETVEGGYLPVEEDQWEDIGELETRIQ